MNKIESILKEALEKIQMEKDESSLNIEKERLEVEKRKLEIEEKRLILEEKREENQEKRHNELLKTLKVLTGIETSSNHLNLEEITDHLKDENGNKVELEEVVITKGEEPKFDEIKKEDKQNKKRNSKKIEVQEETKIEEVKAEEPKEEEKTLEQMQKELGFPTTQSLFPVEKKEEKPRPVSFTSMIGKMKEDMVEVNKKIESGELVTGVEKVELYDEPEDEKKDVVDMNLGADSNLKPFAIVPEETKVAANEVVDEFLAKMNQSMDEAEIKEEGNIEESKKTKEVVVEDKPKKSPLEVVKEIIKNNPYLLSYKGEGVIPEKPTEQELAEYYDLVTRALNSPNFDPETIGMTGQLSMFSTGENLTEDELARLKELNQKMSDWQLYSGAVNEEGVSIADVMEEIYYKEDPTLEEILDTEAATYEYIESRW
jgi:hypothetical protein